MKVAEVVSPGKLGIAERDRPVPGRGEVLVQVERVGICGSDLHYLPHAPVGGVIGHEFIGTIVATGPDVAARRAGERVCTIPCIGCGACRDCLDGNPVRCPDVRMHGSGRIEGMGGFAEFVLAGARECIVLPAGMDLTTAALIEPLAVGLHLVERAAIGVGERLAVLGAGPIGLCCVAWAKTLGVAEILVSDPVAARRSLAMRMGATLAVDPRRSEPGAALRERCGSEADVVIECIGRPGRFDMATAAVRRGGRVILGGMVMEPETFAPMGPFMKDLRVEFVIQYARRHFTHTVAMLEQGRLDPRPMISAEIGLDELPAIMAELLAPNDHCKVLVAPGRRLDAPTENDR